MINNCKNQSLILTDYVAIMSLSATLMNGVATKMFILIKIPKREYKAARIFDFNMANDIWKYQNNNYMLFVSIHIVKLPLSERFLK